MTLLDFLNQLPDADARERFAVLVGTTLQSLRNVAYGSRIASAALASQIEIHTEGRVTRAELRPDDWHRIWDVRLHQLVDARAIVNQSAAAANDVSDGERAA